MNIVFKGLDTFSEEKNTQLTLRMKKKLWKPATKRVFWTAEDTAHVSGVYAEAIEESVKTNT